MSGRSDDDDDDNCKEFVTLSFNTHLVRDRRTHPIHRRQRRREPAARDLRLFLHPDSSVTQRDTVIITIIEQRCVITMNIMS